MVSFLHHPMRRTIIYKVANGCNLGCGYCYERRRLGSLKPNESDDMAPLLPYLEREAHEHEGNRYMICLHGGEPLLMGVTAFERIASCLERLNEETSNSFSFSLQTNATLMSAEWAQAFLRYESLMGERGIGVSLDGDEQTHDSFRKLLVGGGSYEAVMKGVDCLKHNNVPFGVLSVTTQTSIQRASNVFDAIMDISPKFWRILPCYNLTSAGAMLPYSVKPTEYADYLKEQFMRWVGSGMMRQVIVDPFATIISVMNNQPIPWCEYREDKCENFLSVETDGSLCICDTFDGMTYKDEVQLRGCNFHQSLLDMPKYYYALKAEMDSDCRKQNCPASEVCHGGCYGMRWLFRKKNYDLYKDYCLAKRSLILYLSQAVKIAETH